METERRAILEAVIRILRAETSRLGITEAYLVGSLTKEGEWAEKSDVDVAIWGGDPLYVMTMIEAAVGREVDVIDLRAHPAPGMFRRRGVKVIG